MEQQKIIKEIWLRNYESVCEGDKPTIKISKDELIDLNIGVIGHTIVHKPDLNGVCLAETTFDRLNLNLDTIKMSSCVFERLIYDDFAIAGIDLIYENDFVERYHLPFDILEDCDCFSVIKEMRDAINICVEVE